MTETLDLLNKKINDKIKHLTEKAGFDFESDNANSRSIYNLYAHRYGIIIINDWGGDNESQYTVIDAKTKEPITGKDLNTKLQDIISQESKAKRTLEHVPNEHNGKIHTITSTAYVHPNAQILEAILNKAKCEIPLEKRIEVVRRCDQEILPKIKDLTFEQVLEQVLYLERSLQIHNDLLAEFFKVKNAKAYKEVQQEHYKAQIKANKKQPKAPKVPTEPKVKMSKQDEGIWKTLSKGATQEQFEAKKRALLAILNDSQDSPSPENESSSEKKFNISTTSVKEQTFGENSGS